MDHEVTVPGGPVSEGTAEMYQVAQSGDATCNGLFTPTEGSRTMMLKKGESEPFLQLFLACRKCCIFITIVARLLFGFRS